tara:strand:+ start:80 stop:250 length:171 start_codon:yes stop_codon:yes gene_type:complete
MAQQSSTGFGVAHPVPFLKEQKGEKLDTLPSDKQPPGTDEEKWDEDISIEEALSTL